MKSMLRRLLLALVCAAPSVARAQPVARTLRVDSARSVTVYVAGPESARRGIVLVHDWFGVSPAFLEAIERFARAGYRVAGVDLYHGRRATTHEQAGALLSALDTARAAAEIDATVRELSRGDRRLAIMGFSMGARPALGAALRNRAIVAAVVWYGETINDPARLRDLSGPVLLVVGSKDGAAAANAALFSQAADEAGAGAETFVYPGAAHAFAQPLFNQGRTYDAVAAGAAWRLTDDFLRRRLAR